MSHSLHSHRTIRRTRWSIMQWGREPHHIPSRIQTRVTLARRHSSFVMSILRDHRLGLASVWFTSSGGVAGAVNVSHRTSCDRRNRNGRTGMIGALRYLRRMQLVPVIHAHSQPSRSHLSPGLTSTRAWCYCHGCVRAIKCTMRGVEASAGASRRRRYDIWVSDRTRRCSNMALMIV